ncbi:uncharacterized protein LOC116064081 isoform X2 [Sander lucioperca]|uniref:uncharacterized protein LOC116064081 isoform X2 n=1 Tax=Sander lucioperca TaxID=283035 RepID=UPI00125D9607|nr:uncharacterized protein LOC116064081 isoform X2 [Sander lucioperca]
MKQSLITALILCSISWISVSGSESHTETVEGRPGGEVTLTCSNPSSRDAATLWLRVFNRTKASFISAMFSSTVKPLYSNGSQNGRFNMSTNISTLFLQIKHVDVSDSGLYLCGFYIGGPFHFSAIHFNVKGSDDSHDDTDRKSESSDESHDDDRKSEKSDGTAKLMSLILGALTVLLLMVIIGLVVKNRKLQKAANEEQNPQQPENQTSEELNYAAVAFCPKTRKTREVEPNVVYASTR